MSRGPASVYAQQWQQYLCKDSISTHANSSAAKARFRSCADLIPLCISDEGFSSAFQNYLFLAVLLLAILLVILPNVILGLCYTRVWVWKSRKIGQESENSVITCKEQTEDKLLTD
ncbi:unnamed protein product [Gongylonema pulchrum]|uniref:Uncharacterized protein n=1 Tax=Gongylonema pulchrum TaxID=637853 RepID=A0A183DTZ8_9BILA|nr:unnamed protein product [Gongylonema pulchrum]